MGCLIINLSPHHDKPIQRNANASESRPHEGIKGRLLVPPLMKDAFLYNVVAALWCLVAA